MKVKYIILIAHQLVVVGDTICRNVQESTVKNHIEQCTKALSAGISTVVQKSKIATQLFPSVTAVQEMVDCVVEILHIVNDLKVSVLKIKWILFVWSILYSSKCFVVKIYSKRSTFLHKFN